MDEEPELARKERQERATRIRTLLRQVQLSISLPHRVPAPGDPPPDIRYSELKGTLEEFELFLYHGEYERAWGILATVVNREKPTPACWEPLAEAAMVSRKFERHDSYFIDDVVRYHADLSAELHAAIRSLPLRVEISPDTVCANVMVVRLNMIRRSGEGA